LEGRYKNKPSYKKMIFFGGNYEKRRNFFLVEIGKEKKNEMLVRGDYSGWWVLGGESDGD